MLDNYTILGFTRGVSTKTGSPVPFLIAHIVSNLNMYELSKGCVGQKVIDVFLDISTFDSVAIEENVGKVAKITKDIENKISGFEIVG